MTEKKEKKLTNPWADTEVDSVEENEETQDSNLFDVNFDQLVDQLGAEMPKEDTEDDLEEEEQEETEEKTEETEETKTEGETEETKTEKTEKAEEAEKSKTENAQNAQNEQKEAETDEQNAQNAQNKQKGQGSLEENTKELTDSLSVDPANFFGGFDQVNDTQTSRGARSNVFNPSESHASKVFDPTGNSSSEDHKSKVFDPAGNTTAAKALASRKSKVFDPSANKEKKETVKESSKETVKESSKETLPVSGSQTTVLDFDPLAEVKEALGEDKFSVLKRQLDDADVNAIVKTALDSYLAAVEEAKKKALTAFKSDASLGLVNAHLEVLKKEQAEAEAWKAEINK